MKTRYIQVAGTRASLRTYWDDHVFDARRQIYVGKNTCPNSYGRGVPGAHDASVKVVESTPGYRVPDIGGDASDYDEARWPYVCDFCGSRAPEVPAAQSFSDRQHDGCVLEYQLSRKTVYATYDGSWFGLPEVGDVFYEDWFKCGEEREGRCIHGWTNCMSHHLMVIVPTMHWWDLSGRASNCTKKNDTTHRCWIAHGDPATGELVHVDKNGLTGQAGAGSLAISGWHGFLHHGDIHERCNESCRQ